MSFFLVLNRVRIIKVLTLAALVGCALLAASALSRFALASKDPSLLPSRLESLNRLEGEAREEQIEAEVVTVRESGFEPREISRPQGPFMLAIINRNGAAELALRLESGQRNRVHEVHLPKGRVRWNKILDLPPGDYVLTEQNHPDWICRLKLTVR